MIAILCPTRGRPEQCRRMIESVFATTTEPIEIFLYVADDDPRMDDYNKLSLSYGHEDDVFWCHGVDHPTVHKWNYLSQQASDAKILMLAADDTYFTTPGWDQALSSHYEKLENKIHVYHLQDSRDPDGTPHPIVTREYIDAMGYFMVPIFLHWFVDTWAVSAAKACGIFTHLKNYTMVHDKPSDHGQPDETHSRIRRIGWYERDKYVNETCQHYLGLEKQRLAKALQ